MRHLFSSKQGRSRHLPAATRVEKTMFELAAEEESEREEDKDKEEERFGLYTMAVFNTDGKKTSEASKHAS